MADTRYECKKIDLQYFDNAPFRVVSKITAPCTPEALFKSLEDADSWPIWVDAIDNVEWTTPKPFCVGTTRTVSLSGGKMLAYEEFLAWETNKRMTFRFNQLSTKQLRAFGEDYQITDLNNGSCELVWTVALEMGGVMKYIAPLIKPLMRKTFQKILNGLRDYMETEGHRYA